MRVPTIAELEKMVEEAKANPKRKKAKRSGGSRRNSKRTNYAEQALSCNWGLVETVKRVNEKSAQAIEDDIPWQGEPWTGMPNYLGEIGL